MQKETGFEIKKKTEGRLPRLTVLNWKAGANGREIALDEIAYSLQFIKGYSASKVGSIGG